MLTDDQLNARRAPDEEVAPIDDNAEAAFRELRRQVVRFADDIRERVQKSTRRQIPGCHDRAWDNWWPLLAIAEHCGDEWLERAVAAAHALSSEQEEESLGVELLRDHHDVFQRLPDPDKVFSADLVAALVDLEGRPWTEYGKTGKNISQRQLATLLKSFKVSPENVRTGVTVKKGYRKEQFRDAFTRYLDEPDKPPTAPASANSSATPLHPSNGGAFRSIGSATPGARVADGDATPSVCVADEISRKRSNDAACSGVADAEPVPDARELPPGFEEVEL